MIGEFKNPQAAQRYFEAYDRAMALCPPPDEVCDVETRHGTTRVYRFGQGDAPPLVLLPGLMATSAGYWQLLPRLPGMVYAVDTLGEAGRSVQTAPLVDHADRARCLDDVLEQLALTDVHLVGVSTGGWHAVNQAIHAPKRVASITLLEPTTVTAKFSAAVIRHGVLAVLGEWGVRRFLRYAMGEDLLDRPDARLVHTALRTYRPRAPFQKCPSENEIRAIDVPVRALFGARSVAHDAAAAADRLRALLPGSEVEVLPDAGHNLFAQLEQVVAWVNRERSRGEGK